MAEKKKAGPSLETTESLYEKAVETLIILDDVTDYDIAFQAERLKVTVSQLKRWLYDDGYYERIFSPEPVEKRYSYL